MRMPALAVVGPDRQVLRSTEAFRRRCENAVALCERSLELNQVLTGQTDAAVVDLGDFAVAIEAVTDAAGERQAMLTVPADELSADSGSPLAALREAADDSPAMVWIKDLDGRYLYVNPRFEYALDTVEERVLGHTDADLPPVETVDGPRLKYAEDGLEEPLQLEYTVPEFESRPALVAFRFAVRGDGGEPIATCGVADRSTQAHVAREEAVRLMQIERWNRLDPLVIRAELLQQWDVRSAPVSGDGGSAPLIGPQDAASPEQAEASASAELGGPPASPPPTPAPDPIPDQVNGASRQREHEWVRQLRQADWMAAEQSASDTFDALQSDLQLARKWAERADELRRELQNAQARVGQAEAEAEQTRAELEAARSADDAARSDVEAARAAVEAAHSEMEVARAEAEAARAEAEAARSEAEAARAEAEAARSEAEAAKSELDAARDQAASLRGPADAALALSEELGQVLAAERERGDELASTLARIRARLGDLETAFERPPVQGSETR